MKLKCTAKLPRITETIRQWCGEQFQTETLLRLPVDPHLGSLPMQCASNVEMMCQLNGGRLAEGWLLWENYGVTISTEHHITWEDPTGQLVDPTPQNGFAHVLFADTGRRLEIDTEEFSAFCDEWHAEQFSREEYSPYLLLVDHPRVRQLAADLQATQNGLGRYQNERILASKTADETIIDRYWKRLNSIAQQLEDFSNREPKGTAKLRENKKAERQRRKKQRRLCRR